MKSVIQGLGGPRGLEDPKGPEGPGGLEGSKGSECSKRSEGRSEWQEVLGSLHKSSFD